MIEVEVEAGLVIFVWGLGIFVWGLVIFVEVAGSVISVEVGSVIFVWGLVTLTSGRHYCR